MAASLPHVNEGVRLSVRLFWPYILGAPRPSLPTIPHPRPSHWAGGPPLGPRSPLFHSHERGGRLVCRSPFGFIWMVIHACISLLLFLSLHWARCAGPYCYCCWVTHSSLNIKCKLVLTDDPSISHQHNVMIEIAPFHTLTYWLSTWGSKDGFLFNHCSEWEKTTF